MRRRRISLAFALRAAAGLVCAALFVLPLYWASVTSLQEAGVPPSGAIRWWEPDPHWENYAAIFEIVPLARYTLNSVFVVAVAVPLTVLTASLAGFALSQLGPSSRSRLINVSVAMMLVPSAAKKAAATNARLFGASQSNAQGIRRRRVVDSRISNSNSPKAGNRNSAYRSSKSE